ncbi:hypothetical protein VCRA2116O29_110065 [Vibrio crassostreae]|nr:hypothetical protein VCRA2116O29_110065 [Vibrio crassostreae]CAK2440619.1 hypothetical protein VCRA2119O48_210007 [Vibrio crassostreae]CAK3566544.1 hypothetical protein VCRA2123O74_110037 [Vibrio crassostreae]CAK3842495.1 hypothetical protein VCRA212O16_220008 [Vibrio crassostreae]
MLIVLKKESYEFKVKLLVSLDFKYRERFSVIFEILEGNVTDEDRAGAM